MDRETNNVLDYPTDAYYTINNSKRNCTIVTYHAVPDEVRTLIRLLEQGKTKYSNFPYLKVKKIV